MVGRQTPTSNAVNLAANTQNLEVWPAVNLVSCKLYVAPDSETNQGCRMIKRVVTPTDGKQGSETSTDADRFQMLQFAYLRHPNQQDDELTGSSVVLMAQKR